MNRLDKQYQELLDTIIRFGVDKKDRTGTGTKSIFGYTIRHNMKNGFPLLTTKKMAWKQIVTELLWFLRGDTNIKFLLDNDCHIWDGDAYKNYERRWETEGKFLSPPVNKFTKEEFINEIKTNPMVDKELGELGPIYGKQWRSWNTYQNYDVTRYQVKQIDQIANLINELKTNPDSRRLMVSAWNVGELDQMVLPPCHYGFQVYTRELSDEERMKLAGYEDVGGIGQNIIRETVDMDNTIPRRAISLMWNQRSVDTFLGLPFNIASYGLLLEIIAKAVNMVPDELIGNLGDVHLYSNHIEQAKEQIGRDLTLEERIELASIDKHFDPLEFGVGDQSTLEHSHHICDEYGVPRRTRQPYDLPKLQMKSEDWESSKKEKKDIYSSMKPDDFIIENYQSHQTIKAPLSN